MRILGVTGPLDMPPLLDALTRARRWKDDSITLAAQPLTFALLELGATQDAADRWRAPPGFPVPGTG